MSRILVIDVGGTHVKLLTSGAKKPIKFVSGPQLTPTEMVQKIKVAVEDRLYDVVSIGYPGPVVDGHPFREPYNLASGWVGFNFSQAFGRPVKVMNDAAMQALGSYKGGRMLFLGLGTGLGSAMIVDGTLQPMEIAHLPYKHGKTYEDYMGLRGLKRLGRKKWEKKVNSIVTELRRALQAEYVVLGGGNAKKLKTMPDHATLGSNDNAFVGGFRMWSSDHERPRRSRPSSRGKKGAIKKGRATPRAKK
ncbi:MAG: ROK family protein [Terriglobales bacterium]